MTKEIWKDIPGYEGYYQVSNKGRVRSLDREIGGGGRNPGTMMKKGIILSQANHTYGYKTVTLAKKGKNSRRYVHRLVARSFIGLPNKKVINHKNGNKADNRIDNLEIVTQKENNEHALRVLGVSSVGLPGEKCPTAKLTKSDVIEIRRLHASKKYTQRELAKMFNVCFQNIHLIIRRKSWKHID